MKSLVVLSGGMDSSAALGWAMKTTEVLGAISFWYGSKHNDREWESAQMVCRFYGISIKRVRLDFVASEFESDLLLSGGDIPEGHYADPTMKRTVVPFRNGIMLSIAAGYAEVIGAAAVVLGNHFGDHAVYPDCRKDFIEPMALAIEKGTYGQVKLLSPFCDKTKTDITRIGEALGVPFKLTYSCYKGGPMHCGRCGTCVERKEAFTEGRVTDPTLYDY